MNIEEIKFKKSSTEIKYTISSMESITNYKKYSDELRHQDFNKVIDELISIILKQYEMPNHWLAFFNFESIKAYYKEENGFTYIVKLKKPKTEDSPGLELKTAKIFIDLDLIEKIEFNATEFINGAREEKNN